MGFALQNSHQHGPQSAHPQPRAHWGTHHLLPCHPHLGLILPRDATQPSVQLQVFTSCELIKQGIKLRAVAKALLNLEQVLEHTGDRG